MGQAISIGADFSRTCEGCEYIRTERWPVRGKYHETTDAFRCFAPGPRQGYHIGTTYLLKTMDANYYLEQLYQDMRLRVLGICALRIQDIDSKQMRAFVRNSKRDKDRYTILSRQCLEFLRDYWHSFRPNHPERVNALALPRFCHILMSPQAKWIFP